MTAANLVAMHHPPLPPPLPQRGPPIPSATPLFPGGSARAPRRGRKEKREAPHVVRGAQHGKGKGGAPPCGERSPLCGGSKSPLSLAPPSPLRRNPPKSVKKTKKSAKKAGGTPSAGPTAETTADVDASDQSEIIKTYDRFATVYKGMLPTKNRVATKKQIAVVICHDPEVFLF